MKTIFTKHAVDKFETLRRHKFIVTREQVLETVENPDIIDYSRLPLLIAQRPFDRSHILRVVYKQEGGIIRIITFYPGRKLQYEKQ